MYPYRRSSILPIVFLFICAMMYLWASFLETKHGGGATIGEIFFGVSKAEVDSIRNEMRIEEQEFRKKRGW